MLKELFVCRDHTKWLVFLIFSFFLCTQSFADYYRVTAPNGLNVRASANKNGEVLGQLSQDNVIDVISIENGWANFNYNGWQGYVSASYLEAVTDTGATGASAKEESWDLTSWLFDSEGESVWFTALKWILVIGGFKDLHKGATESWSSSSSSSSGGLKTASFTESGTVYNLTQDSPYSECDYTDQFGGKWGRDSSGFYRK